MIKKKKNISKNKRKGIKLNRLLKLYKQCSQRHCPILMLLKKHHSLMNEYPIFDSSDTVKYAFPQKNDTLIKKPSDYRHLSMIRQSNELKDILIPEGYYTIAIDALTKAQNSSDNVVKDSLIFPILFCFRHYLEIMMKDSIRKFGIANKEITSEQIGYDKEHSLLIIWNKLKKYIYPAQTEECLAFEKLINEITQIDNKSFSFRYVYDGTNNINPIFKDAIEIDLYNLKSVMEKMHNFIEDISDRAYHELEISQDYF